jgi:hypothetical protein
MDFNIIFVGLIIGIFAHVFGDTIGGTVPVAYLLSKKRMGLGVLEGELETHTLFLKCII